MRVLGVFAHPDDEVLSCGGTFARLADDGADITTIFMANGETGRQPDYVPAAMADRIAARQDAARAAAEILGCGEPVFLNFPDNRMDTVGMLTLVKALEEHALPLAPDMIFTHHGGDLNIDHRLTFQTVLTAFRPLPGRKPDTIYTCETLSSTEWSDPAIGPGFQPARFVNVADWIERKQAAMTCYDAETAPFPHPRSAQAITAQAQSRGAQSGLPLAEAFGVARDILR